nr:PDZ domain-containing protein [Propionibacterium sp.]
MTYPTTPPPQRRLPVASLVVGVTVALLANAFTLSGVASLRESWRPTPSPTVTTRSPSTLPSPSARPTTASPTRRASTPAALATNGPVRVTDDLERGVVLIEASTGQSISSGTGMIVGADGRVLTNYHVVRSTSSIEVIVAATERRYSARLIGRDATEDVALLQIEGGTGFETITRDPDPVRIGDRVVVAGNAGGQGYLTAFSGGIVGTQRSVRVRGAAPDDPEETLSGLIETDAHAEPGDSGGPLFDAQAEVIGMTTAGSSTSGRSDATAFAVPIGTALAVVERVLAGDESGTVVIGPKPSLGITAQNSSAGVRVQTVVPGSAAERAGLEPGDVITGLGRFEVASLSELAAAIDSFEPGDTTELRWATADGDERSGSITLDESRYN